MKKLKVFLSLFLAIVLTSIMVLPAFAANTDCDCGHAPVIQVRGIGETLYDAEGNEIFSTENIVNAILPVMPQLAQFLLDTSNTELFVDAAETAVKTIFGPVMYDNNAARENTVTVNCNSAPVEDYMDFSTSDISEEEKLAKALYEELGDDHVYLFTYDWTANPYDVVDQLEAFIEEVKTQSNHDKVSINAESMGGAIVNLYLDKNGHSDIENLVMANSAFNGLEMLGQLFTGNPDIDGEALAYLITQSILGNSEYESLLAYIPIFEQLALMANNIMTAEHDAIYERILIPVFGYMPSFWCLVPGYSIEEAKDVMFGENTAMLGETRANAGSELLKIVNKISVASNNTDTLVDRMINGYKLFGFTIIAPINSYANVTNYNRYIAPVTPSSNWNSDGVIEVYNASGWATAADMGYNLGENYVQAELTDVGNFVSPDNIIDASTCQAPLNTWFIKNLSHVSYGLDDGVADFYVWLLTATDAQDINTNADYPQFMYYDTNIPQLMTWEEKAENDAQGGISFPNISLPGLPEIDLGSLAAALEQIIRGLGEIDFSALTGIITSLGGIVGSLGDMISGLLGGSTGTDTPADDGEDEGDDFGDSMSSDTSTDTSTPNDTSTSTDTSTNTGTSHVGSSKVDRTKTQSTGVVLSENPVFSSGASSWIILFVIAAIIAGILIIKL